MNVMPTEMAFRSHKGRVRKINEDSIAVLDEHGLVVLADGMGGYNAGDVASQLAVETVVSNILPIYASAEHETIGLPLSLAVEAANETILTTMLEDPALDGMATTLVVGLFADGWIYHAHVGDSRLYRYRGGQLQQMTRDHSMIQGLVDDGVYDSIAQAQAAGVKNNVLLRGLGIAAEVEVDQGMDQVAAGDLYLFCSDGLSNMVPDDEISAIIDASADELVIAADRLLERALAQGGLDNITLALVLPRL